MFHKIMGILEKNAGNRGYIKFFSPIILVVALKRAQKSNWGKIYDIFPLVGKSNHIFPAGHNLFL
jgi:hypothetical protein